MPRLQRTQWHVFRPGHARRGIRCTKDAPCSMTAAALEEAQAMRSRLAIEPTVKAMFTQAPPAARRDALLQRGIRASRR
ncbi:hypothetical protein [Pseudorhodoferax sp.]|uniref:hypothetical protein n=1 Tax=Pseudorhodoferax sp. TaxID=1993553 RepID=UPI0039E42B52